MMEDSLQVLLFAWRVFLFGVGIWTILAVRRMEREQFIALGILHALEARLGLSAAVDQLQVQLLHDQALKKYGVDAIPRSPERDS